MNDLLKENAKALQRTLEAIARNKKEGKTDLVKHYQASLYAFISFHQHDCTVENRACTHRLLSEYDKHMNQYKNNHQ